MKKIQDTIFSKGFFRPKYIGCQHHILDTILRHVLNFYLNNRSTKPELEYDFIDQIEQQYEDLQNRYPGKEDIQRTDNPGWRSDFKFLYELCQSFRFLKVRIIFSF